MQTECARADSSPRFSQPGSDVRWVGGTPRGGGSWHGGRARAAGSASRRSAIPRSEGRCLDVVSANLNDNVPVNAGSRGLGEHGVLAPDGLRPPLHPPPAATRIESAGEGLAEEGEVASSLCQIYAIIPALPMFILYIHTIIIT